MPDLPSKAPESSAAKRSDLPQSVGRYQIIGRLGEGGMGSVFLAEDTILRRQVALKLPLSGTESDPEVRERFLHEARAAATLDHPYICRVYDADVVEGRLYLAMAYIEGKSLADLIRAEGIPPRQVVALVGKLAIAMNEAHLKGVIHRDLKPRNVMIRTVGSRKEPVIVDFGLARLASVEDPRITKTGEVMGTPAYMSPEQLRGDPAEIGPATDIYALGVMLHELLTGRLPFSGNYPVMVAQILTQPPLPPSTHRPGLDPALDAICLKAMNKDVSKRHASMMELATALTEYLRATPTVSISNRPIAPISRPVESDSIPTGADTLVSQFLERSEEPENRFILGIVLDTSPPAISTEAVRKPMSASASLVSAATEGSSRRISLRRRLAASGLLALIVLTGIIVSAKRFWNRPKVQELASADPKPQSKVPRSLDVSRPSDKPMTVVETTSTPKADESLIINSIGMKLKLIPDGEFLMGSDGSDPNAVDAEKVNGQKHRVQISRPFYMGTTEVTVGQFRRFVERNPRFQTDAEKDGKGGHGWNDAKKTFEQRPEYTWRTSGFPRTDEHPVMNVSWNDAMAFCDFLSKEEGRTYRLPTEAEWEYSCRAGQEARFCFGDNPATLVKVANVADATTREMFPSWSWTIKSRDGYIFTAPVGQFQANEFGLFDMHGNVLEWCADWYDPGYYAKLPSPAVDPQNRSPTAYRVNRGGSWFSSPQHCRSARRDWLTPSDRYYSLGFRVALVRSDK